MKLVSIIITCFNQLEYTKLCVESVLQSSSLPHELVFVDNGSTDGTQGYLATLRERADVPVSLVLNDTNRGVAGALNQGIAASRGDYFCFLNNDVIVSPGWLEGLVRCAESGPKTGLIGCMTNLVRNAGGGFPDIEGCRDLREVRRTAALLAAAHAGQYEPVDYVHGFCMLIRREAVEAVGLFDERFYPVNGEDLDYSLRLKRSGFSLLTAKEVFVFHFYHRTSRSEHLRGETGELENRARDLFMRKWGDEGRDYLSGIEQSVARMAAGVRRSISPRHACMPVEPFRYAGSDGPAVEDMHGRTNAE